MQRFLGPSGWAAACPHWRGGNGGPHNYRNPSFGGPRPPFRGRGANEQFGSRFCAPRGHRWPQMFRGGQPYPRPDRMSQPWGPPFRPQQHPPGCFAERFSRVNFDAPAAYDGGDGDICNPECLQYARPGDRLPSPRRRQATSSEGSRDAVNRRAPSSMPKTDTLRKMREPRRSRSSEHSSRSSSSSLGDRPRERRASRECQWAAESRGFQKVRKRDRTRSRSPDYPRRRQRSESVTRGHDPFTSRSDARAERKSSSEHSSKKRNLLASKRSVDAEALEWEECPSEKPGSAADGKGNADHSVAVTKKKRVSRKGEYGLDKPTLGGRKSTPTTRKGSSPQVPSVTNHARVSRLCSRCENDETHDGGGAQGLFEDRDNLAHPSIEDNHQMSRSQLQPVCASPDSTVDSRQRDQAYTMQPSLVVGTEGEETVLCVPRVRKVTPSAALKTNGEDVDPDAAVSENSVGERNRIGHTETAARSVFPGGFKSPPRNLCQHTNAGRQEIASVAKNGAVSSITGDKSINVEEEEDGNGTLTQAHCLKDDSVGQAVPPELLAVLRKTAPGTTQAFIEWFKSLKAPNNAGDVFKEHPEPQDLPTGIGMPTPAPMNTDVQIPGTSAATYVDPDAPSMSVCSAQRDDKSTESIATTLIVIDDVLEVSSPSEAPDTFGSEEDCYMTCAKGSSASAGSSVQIGEQTHIEVRPRIYDGEFPALARCEKKILYDLYTYTAVLILELLRYAQQISRVLSLYEKGLLDPDKRASCSEEIRRTVLKAIDSLPSSRKSFASKLRKLANFRWEIKPRA